jgi:uroporphyrin-III C-methyltransferase / precorrin-2 dehydrogenase / sirohydrochlorin ferrochelatase
MKTPPSTIRTPAPAALARIAPMATLPLFHKLGGRKAVVAGDSDGAVWKAELLAASGAAVHVFAPQNSDAFSPLVGGDVPGSVHVLARNWVPADLEGAALAIADARSDEEAEAFAFAAHSAGAVVNIIDRPAFCDAQFGTIVNRSPLLVAISTDGAAPVFGQFIRARIEALLPQGLKSWAQAARDWRPLIQARDLSFAARRQFWERFSARALQSPDVKPQTIDREAMMKALDCLEVAPPSGRVTLVGAGPGDPDLLTVKAIRALQSADIILYDDLVSAEVLEQARREAKCMLVGKTGHGPSCRQSDISALMVKLALGGKHVVRLKSGDPLIFGRATEEIAACRAAGIAVSIVPGITAAQGAGASLGVSLTERHAARRLQFVTGHANDGHLPQDIDWQAVADPCVTTIVYMPRSTLAQFRQKALAAGLDPQTSAAAMVNVSRETETCIVTIIETLPEQIQEMPDGPMLVILGRVLENARCETDSRAMHIDDGKLEYYSIKSASA